MEQKLDQLQGQLFAFGLALQAIIRHLPPDMAQRCADTLMVSMHVQDEADAEDGTPAREAASRNAIGDALHGLLTTVAKLG